MKMNAIHWPDGFIPGLTDNFCSNEVIVTDLTPEAVWPLLATPACWPEYYANSANAHFYDNKGPVLEQDVRFCFETFGFRVEAKVTNCVPPVNGEVARLAWHGWSGEEGAADRLDVLHAWLIEALPGNRLRILTQETQNGNPAKELAVAKPNPMINGHQEWLDGLVAAARSTKR